MSHGSMVINYKGGEGGREGRKGVRGLVGGREV